MNVRATNCMLRVILFGFLAACLGACATTPVSSSAARQAPSARLLAFQERFSNTTATLIVTRDEGFLGGGCYYSLAINGTLAARLDVGETSRFYVEPGEIVLRVGRDPEGKGLCGVGQDEWTLRETLLRAGEFKYFRLSIDGNGKTDTQRSD